jgi:hypothetical protein
VVNRYAVAGAAAAAVLALAGCGSGATGGGAFGPASGAPAPSASPSAPASSAPTVAPAVTATPTATVTVTPKPTTTTAGGTAGPCTDAQVSVVSSDSQGAAGTLVARFTVTNTSGVTCTMDQWPFISPYGLSTQGSSKVEANLPVTVGHIPSTFGDLGQAGGLQTLHPGGRAYFFLTWSQVPVNDQECPTADGFDFRPPQDSTGNKLVDYTFTPCGGEVRVSQILPTSVTE